jgi:hypothetical protein
MKGSEEFWSILFLMMENKLWRQAVVVENGQQWTADSAGTDVSQQREA